MKIIAIGGGGFTHGTFPVLDDFCLSHARDGARGGEARPRMAFIGTASGDEAHKVSRFMARFQDCAATLIHLPMTMSASALAGHLEKIDLVYVGGGDTEKMVARWRHDGWDEVLGDAYRSGVTLAGVSAGAMCWFDAFLFSASGSPNAAPPNTDERPMRPLPGLGLLAMGACPHFSTEPDRRAALHAAVAARTMPTSLAIDDGVAVAFEDGRPSAMCSAVAGAGCYRISWSETGALEDPVSLG